MSLTYRYITTSDERDRAVAELMTAKQIGVDVEGDSLYHYNDRVTLLQISDGERHFIFDPLQLPSLWQVAPLFENRAILKIFHGAEYDIASLKRDFGFKIGPVFDTALAARAIGMPQWSLKALVLRFFHLTISKAYQKSNWSIRPLSLEQLHYASEDVAHLPALCSVLTRALLENGRMAQVKEDNRFLEDLVWVRPGCEPPSYLRIKGSSQLDVTAQKILRELVLARDRLARERDIPPFKVTGNNDLFLLASQPPHTEEEFLKRFPKGFLARDPSFWLAAIRKGALSEEPLPAKQRKGDPPLMRSQQKLFSKLKAWRDGQAKEEKVDTAMILGTLLLKAIARKKPLTLEAFASIPALRQWQINRYGDALLQIIRTDLPEPERTESPLFRA